MHADPSSLAVPTLQRLGYLFRTHLQEHGPRPVGPVSSVVSGLPVTILPHAARGDRLTALFLLRFETRGFAMSGQAAGAASQTLNSLP